MSESAFQYGAFQFDAFQIVSPLYLNPAFQPCAFQLDAFQSAPCPEPPADEHIGGAGGSGPTHEKARSAPRTCHHVYPGAEYGHEQTRKRTQQDQIIIDFVVNFTLQHLTD